MFEYNLFKSIIDSNKKVFISGHFDRITIIISHICKHNNIELTVVQHGALEYFENMPKIYVSNVIYMYKFSEHYFRKYYYPIKNEIIYIYNQDLVSDVDKFLNCKLEKKTIAFLTQPEKINFNILIIKAMLTCRDKYNLNIILHPRDKKNDYKEFFNEPSIVFSRNFCLNYHAVVTRSSTLGINFHNKNVKTIFVNLEGLQMDFYDIENIILINNLNNLDSLLNE